MMLRSSSFPMILSYSLLVFLARVPAGYRLYLVSASTLESGKIKLQESEKTSGRQLPQQLRRRRLTVDADDDANSNNLNRERFLERDRMYGVSRRERLSATVNAGGAAGGNWNRIHPPDLIGEQQQQQQQQQQHPNSFVSTESCNPSSAIDEIPFLYTKNLFVSYDLASSDGDNGLSFQHSSLPLPQQQQPRLLEQALEEAFHQTYNELVKDACPVFADDPERSPTRQVDNAYVMFGYDKLNHQRQIPTNTVDDPSFTTSFFLLSLDFRCSYCHHQHELVGDNTANNDDQDSSICSVALFEDPENSASSSTCSCGMPTAEQFLEHYERVIRDNPSGSLSPNVVLTQVSDVRVAPTPSEEPAAVATRTSSSSSSSSSAMGWEIPIAVSATSSLGCRPSAFVLDRDEPQQQFQLLQPESPINPTRLFRTSSPFCRKLTISGGLPACDDRRR